MLATIKHPGFGRWNTTVATRAANKIFRKIEAAPSEYAKADKAFHANRERLKAERVAREAQASRQPFNKNR